MSVGRESIRRAANAGAGKTVKKPVVSTKEAQQKVLFILMRNCRYIFFKSYL